MLTQLQKNYLEKLFKYHHLLKDHESLNASEIGFMVKDFQKRLNLTIDGILGPKTLWTLQFDYVLKLKDQFKFVLVPADVYKEGFDSFCIRNDIQKMYEEIYNSIHRFGGILTSSGSLRSPYSSNFKKGLGSHFAHYLGLAIDLNLWSGFQDPENDPLVLEFNEESRRWHVYIASFNGSVPIKIVKGAYLKNSKIAYKEVTRSLFSLSDLMHCFGFMSIPADENFLKGKNVNYLLAYWWHFYHQNSFIDKMSLFGIELLKSYDSKLLEKTAIWKFKDAMFDARQFSNEKKNYLKFV